MKSKYCCHGRLFCCPSHYGLKLEENWRKKVKLSLARHKENKSYYQKRMLSQYLAKGLIYQELFLASRPLTARSLLTGPVLQTETALMYDAALLFATALSELDRSQEIETAVLSCDSEQSWEHGNSLINYMKLVSTQRIVYLYPMPVFFMIILMIVSRLRWTDSVGGSSLMGPASAVIFSLILWN